MSESPKNPAQPLLLSLEQVSVAGDTAPILADISLDFHQGEITTLIGPNGAGKSTLVKLVLGLIKPTEGKVKRFKPLRMGYMPQHIHFEKTLPLTVARFLRLSRKDQRQRFEQVLGEVKAEHLVNQSVQSLSGGELQRVLLARALLRNPDFLVLDEPVQGVDIQGQAELYHLIADIRDQYRCAVLMVSHDLHLVMSASDRVVCLNHHICCSGHPEQVTLDPSYQSLFGDQIDPGLALYAHHHDHQHDDHGNVVKEECQHD